MSVLAGHLNKPLVFWFYQTLLHLRGWSIPLGLIILNALKNLNPRTPKSEDSKFPNVSETQPHQGPVTTEDPKKSGHMYAVPSI